MKKFYLSTTLVLGMVLGSMALVACSNDEDNGTIAWQGTPSVTTNQIEGMWYSVDNSDETLSVDAVYIESNGNCIFGEYVAQAKNNWAKETYLHNTMWTLDRGNVIIAINSYEGRKVIQADVLDLAGNTMRVKRYWDNGQTDVVNFVAISSIAAAEHVFSTLLEAKQAEKEL